MTVEKVSVIHVNTLMLRRNQARLKRGDAALQPPLTAKPKAGGKAVTGNTLVLKYRGREVARVVYRPHAPLRSGATAWVETACAVEVLPDPPPTVGAPPLDPALVQTVLRTLVAGHEAELRQLLAEKAPT